VIPLQLSDLLWSQIKDKSILLIEPGNNIQNFIFTGLNIHNSDLNKLHPTSDISEFSGKYFDFIVIHGFLLSNIDSYYEEGIRNFDLSCDTFVIDLLGEGSEVHHVLKCDIDIVRYNNIKIISPLKDYKGLEEKYPDIQFYKYPFAGPRTFCCKYNHTIHYDYQVTNNNLSCANRIIVGKRWTDNPKTKLFTCLNNQFKLHRSFLVNKLVVNNLTDLGFVSNITGDDSEVTFNIFDDIIRYKNYHIKIENDTVGSRFTLNKTLSNTYIDIVTETTHDLLPFMTEKSVKPFYNLQLPMILGYTGIIKDMRDVGFDMFDDIVNHDYDTFDYAQRVDVNTDDNVLYSLNNELIVKKVNFIIEELKRLSKLDFHKIYLDLKERLIHNQNLLYELTIEDNNLVEDYGRWIFGDNITFNKNDYIEKIYI